MFSLENLEASYRQITAIYDLADRIIASVKKSGNQAQEEHFSIVNPLVDQLEESADILTEEFIGISEQQEKSLPQKRARGRVETALRKAFNMLDTTAKRLQDARGSVQQAVEPLIEEARGQMEKVVVIFVNMVDLALDRILKKADLERMKKENEKIAEILHQTAQQALHRPT